jgi:hypothetical protein
MCNWNVSLESSQIDSIIFEAKKSVKIYGIGIYGAEDGQKLIHPRLTSIISTSLLRSSVPRPTLVSLNKSSNSSKVDLLGGPYHNLYPHKLRLWHLRQTLTYYCQL